MIKIKRGEVWLADLGYAAKIRPCLLLSHTPEEQERVIVTMVPHTTSVRGTQYEAVVPKAFLKPGAFDAQGILPVPIVKLIRRLGELDLAELSRVESVVRLWLGFR